ncbi:hypothetical protein [Teredinibacter franksiae]|uniref:hypothetical protein n=1 Tax=Teredinibacter franksiae TaxID=2761453 RepID=UPI0016275960|nr:hypothetical protein [Teredinibacter franksiae]
MDLRKSKLLRVAIFALVVVNAVKYLSGGSSLTTPLTTSSLTSTGTEKTALIPAWLEHSKKSSLGEVADLFSAAPDSAKSTGKIDRKKPQIDKSRKTFREKSDDVGRSQKGYEVLAINISTTTKSALIRYEGNVITVFEGDSLGGSVKISEIQRNRVLLEEVK